MIFTYLDFLRTRTFSNNLQSEGPLHETFNNALRNLRLQIQAIVPNQYKYMQVCVSGSMCEQRVLFCTCALTSGD